MVQNVFGDDGMARIGHPTPIKGQVKASMELVTHLNYQQLFGSQPNSKIWTVEAPSDKYFEVDLLRLVMYYHYERFAVDHFDRELANPDFKYSLSDKLLAFVKQNPTQIYDKKYPKFYLAELSRSMSESIKSDKSAYSWHKNYPKSVLDHSQTSNLDVTCHGGLKFIDYKYTKSDETGDIQVKFTDKTYRCPAYYEIKESSTGDVLRKETFDMNDMADGACEYIHLYDFGKAKDHLNKYLKKARPARFTDE